MASPRDLYDAGAPARRLPSAAGAAGEVLAMGAGGAAAWAAASGGITTTVAHVVPFEAWQDGPGTVPLDLNGGGQVTQDLTVLVVTTTLPSSGSPLTVTSVVIKPATYTIGPLPGGANLGALSAAVPGLPASGAGALIDVQIGAAASTAWVLIQAAGPRLLLRRQPIAVAAGGTVLALAMGISQSITWAASPLAPRALSSPDESPPPAPTADAPDDWDLSELGTPRGSPEPQ